ncbi:MAG: NAD(P)H-dependent oxidoreductase [Tumebacillaceae bacterium]
MKVLVIVAHPNLAESRVNKRWVEELEKHPEITVHNLYKEYPNEVIDVAREQALCLEHDRIVFQFPFYWYSSPSLLKKWQDAVLTYGWAYGSTGTALHGKEFMLATSTGGPEVAYQAGGYNRYSMSELLKPFEATSNLIGTKLLPSFILHGIFQVGDEELEANAQAYANYVLSQA